MTTTLIISALITTFGLGFWTGARAVKDRDVRQKIAVDIANKILDDGLADQIARELTKRNRSLVA